MKTPKSPRRLIVFALLAAFALIVTACGDDDSSTTEPTPEAPSDDAAGDDSTSDDATSDDTANGDTTDETPTADPPCYPGSERRASEPVE